MITKSSKLGKKLNLIILCVRKPYLDRSFIMYAQNHKLRMYQNKKQMKNYLIKSDLEIIAKSINKLSR